MKREHIIRTFAGAFVLSGIALGLWVNRWFFIIPVLVGLNLIQSGITKWCLLEGILKKFDIGHECDIK